MGTPTSIKDRCRLCYTRLRDTSSSHHKLWCSQHNHRIYNIYKRRPYRYRDLIVRYLCIRLPENENNINENNSINHYSRVVCGTCAASLNKLDTAFRTFQQTQKNLRLKFRKTSQIVHYQLDKQIQNSSQKLIKENRQQQHQKLSEIKEQSEEEKIIIPKRQSKRKGAPKHIDQTINNHINTKKSTGGVQLIVKIPSPNHNNHDDDDDNDDDDNNEQKETKTSLLLPTKRTSPRRKPHQIIESEKTNPKKKFKRLTNDLDTSANESYNSINLLKPKILTDIPINDKPTPLSLTTISGSTSSNSRPFNSVKGNHIERIAVSLLSGTDTLTDVGNNNLNLSNGINDYNSNHNQKKTLGGRHTKLSTLEVTTTNNILSSTIPSPSIDEDDLSIGDVSNDSSNTTSSIHRHNTNATIPNVNKNLPSSILATPTAEGLTITAINQTGQKQIFMAKQLGNLKKYQCSLCEKIVTNIQIHVRRHTNDKPYPCTYCEKRFTNSGDLQIHVRIHTGEKPYACPLCLKSYRTIGNFNSHVKTHDSGTRPHRCELCNQTFPIPKDWYSHLRSSHRSRTANNNNNNNNNITPSSSSSSSTLNSTNTTTTVTKPLFSNCLTSQQQHNEIFIPNKVKLEPINRSQLIIKSSTEKNSSNDDDLEPVNMSKKEDVDDDEDEEHDDDDEDDDEEDHHPSTRNLLTNVPSPVHA
ncbi:unnamed protein product [Rotaria sordida]|uniref:C2H2-type domain-containing protein n=1 Tax=Rotaria sordida TaxID=392033 RepID=A0A814DU06_9BILA|nr:unnamed protein product [Rotaria sordida]CAF3487163.1 unnamed protein product [Rotaria sordida]